MNHVARFLSRRGVPLVFGIVALLTPFLSNVPPNLFVVSGSIAAGFLVAYGLVSLSLALVPRAPHRAYAIAAGLGVFAYMGRAGGFLELVLEGDRWDLIPATLLRVAVALVLLSWHYGVMIRRGEEELEPS